jgi:DNA-binding MarR family transcriptional regulator
MKMSKPDIPDDVTRLATAPVEQYLTFRMSRVHAKLTQQASRLLQQSAGLSLVAWRLLVIIHKNGPCTFTEANRDIKMDKGQVSRTVSRMIEDGLLIAEAHVSDQRQQYLRLSPKGLALYQKAEPVMLKRRRYMLSRFSPQELAAFLHGLDILDEAAEKLEFPE